MERMLLRMERPPAGLDIPIPPGYSIVAFDLEQHASRIPEIYGAAFDAEPWKPDWREFDEFDPNGVFVAIDAVGAVGFSICFMREPFGYISVVAVIPEHQRRGLASALVGRCADYLHSLGAETVRIDAWEDSIPAVATYRSLGFAIYGRRLEAG